MINKPFSETLLTWYALHKRELPWRNTFDPYIIWLSEIILQQTRVAQGLPYFLKFAENYPNVTDLAQAPLEEVLRLWQGLGYYSRARNLHNCAIEVVSSFGGKFPDNYQDLLKLKGVGSYTAAAIASFAFGEPKAVVDGNVFRILSRYFGVATDIASSQGKKEFEKLANELIPVSNPGEFNQAIMEFGSLQCTPKNPSCSECPLNSGCFAFNHGLVDKLPLKINKVKVKNRNFLYAHISCGNFIMVKKRESGDIWEGLYDFPLIETQAGFNQEMAENLFVEELKQFKPKYYFEPKSEWKHILTHQRIYANFVKLTVEKSFQAELSSWASTRNYRLVTLEVLDELPKPRLILRYLNGEK